MVYLREKNSYKKNWFYLVYCLVVINFSFIDYFYLHSPCFVWVVFGVESRADVIRSNGTKNYNEIRNKI